MRGLLLDVYGTLVHEDDVSIADITGHIHRYAGVEVDPETIGRAWSAAFFAMCDRSFGANFLTQRDLALIALKEVLDAYKAPLDASLLLERQIAHWIAPPIFADAIPFLDRVAALGIPICIVSNIDRADVEAALGYHGLSFEHIVTSEDARAYKPRPEMFDMAAARLGLAPVELLHVGDSRRSDVVGAGAAGIPVAWVNRTGKTASGDPAADHVVSDLTELARLLGW
ncbi:MAG TPA: HAD-IA family hydrolase [Thermomicrobiales bacterium]|nr:HAD-IA family hydrolase [Thermomicrobiales bacterium]